MRLLVSVSTLALCVASPALAQTTDQTTGVPASSSPQQPAADGVDVADKAALGDIVVTATKRPERLQDVPAAISSLSGDQLRSVGINNVSDLRLFVPSVAYGDSANLRGEGLQIRGVGTLSFSDGIEQSVGTVVDGVIFGRSGIGAGDVLDVDRIEVLRGPQGTLFGKNASAGVISIVTRAPRLRENSVSGRVSYATLDELRAEATVNLALGETAALRISAASNTRDGFLANVVSGKKLNDRNEQLFRGKLLWQPSSALSFTIIGDYSDRDAQCCGFTFRSAPAGSNTANILASLGITASPSNLEIANNSPFFQRARGGGLSAQVDLDTSLGTITSITAYRKWKQRDNNDPDLVPLNILATNSGSNNQRQFTQEIRLASPAGERFSYVLGAFLFDQRLDGTQSQTGTLGVALPAGVLFGRAFDNRVETKSYAVFGEGTFKLSEQLRLIGGARYTDEKVSIDYNRFLPTGGTLFWPGLAPLAYSGSTSANRASFRVGAQYYPTTDIMAYATYSQGFKGPGVDSNLSQNSPGVVAIRPEIPKGIELGIKTTSFDRRLTVNLAAFRTDYRDFQAEIFDQSNFPSAFRPANAGKLRTQGVELELVARPVPEFTLSANMTYLDAKYTDFKNVACYLGQPVLPIGTPRTSPRQCITTASLSGGTTNLTTGDGLPLVNSPKVSYSLAARYEKPVFGGNLVAFAQGNYFWRDRVNFSVAGDPNTVQSAYGLLGISAGIGATDGAWRISAFARNLGNENFAARITAAPVSIDAGKLVYVQFPTSEARRILGVALDVKFGN